MSKECYYCGFRDPLPFTCKFCGNSYCYNHRLPESHNCSGLATYKERVRDSGKLYEYEPDLVAKRHKTPAFAPLANAISVIKSNYSLTILTVIIASFFLQYIIPGYFSYLALSPLDVPSRPWILVTHMFLHDGPFHLLFNMMFLFFFGPELERRIGGRRFLAVFFLSGIVAGIGYSLWTGLILQSNGPAVGASGALMGIFACLAVLAPHIQVYIYFIPMKITYALIMFALLDLFFFGSGDAIAHSAHLSGVIAGLLMGRQIKRKGQFIGY
ncbi:MAG: rhomboid family intramembrane serine protease [Candidatus Methanoperedens sp.]|nr:rhomboid family intramembrane serine protease [Candidatus Methanoperedens sp.]MCZ7395445.1 rhomboid family intramembrane serine protease [Candidatus Methanoperedens sp.]